MSECFSQDGIVLYDQDCRDYEIEADAIITDPPYGMDWNTDSTRFSGGTINRGTGRKDWGKIAGDDAEFDPSRWLDFKHCALWGSNHYWKTLPVGTTLVWAKKHQQQWGSFLSDAEVGWVKGGHGVYLFSNPWNPPARAIDAGGDVLRPVGIHPTQKPVALMAWTMQMAKVPEGARVCDPFSGSGTTAIACIRTRRKFIGFERDKVHFNTAKERIKRELQQGIFAI